MNHPLWLFGDQLGAHFHHGDREVVLIEAESALRRRPYHRQKLHLVLSGMRHLAAELGDRARLLRAPTYRAALAEYGRPVAVHEPGSHAAEDLVLALERDGLVAEVLPTPGFALSRKDFADWAQGRERFVLEEFYRDQRRRFQVLVDAGEPLGGRWNYDADNREPPPKGASRLPVEPPWWPEEDEIDERVRADLDALDLDTVGRDGPRLFPVTAAEAEAALEHFLRHRLAAFGPYEDAILSRDWAMAHSLLSVPLNLGLLHPLDVVRAAERRTGELPLSSVEGFIRQVLGWREYVWHLYWHFGREYVRNNAFRAPAPLPDWWAELDPDAVRAQCLKAALAGVRDRGWVHHIQRLMVLGNHGLQRGYHPAELSDWFTTSFVDGFPWVMPVNVVGMSQHADGGLMATKPYLSGGAYLNRMSDHCSGCCYDPRSRLGDRACPFTAGYWAWLHRNAAAVSGNHRMARAISGLRRLDDIEAVVDQESDREQF
ncbi:cryptochrome/photolyase family protein [Allokutzneria albata]|uniref:Deoxyribodipyrimidine photolyase-related protein n=1 Tax=Allokutzneria albata TaxID=211114 RepID=A0A1G9SH65_ALLAB|nr:cryptochrome/photolyase family protein [Allokutzneria albata]SDM34647.1 deoxyribodipyrimidine photolyase-related protein [Allokutzneria albata]